MINYVSLQGVFDEGANLLLPWYKSWIMEKSYSKATIFVIFLECALIDIYFVLWEEPELCLIIWKRPILGETFVC